MTITYDHHKTTPEQLAAIIEAFEYGVQQVPVTEQVQPDRFSPFPAPLPEDAPREFARAFESARAAKRPMVIDFWAPWCGPCVRLKQETLAHAEVSKQLERTEVIFVNLDEHPQLAKVYGVESIPDVFFVDAGGSVVDRLNAFERAGPFLERLERLLGPSQVSAALGITSAVPSQAVVDSMQLTTTVRIIGRLVSAVEPRSAAADAGLEVDDVLLRLGNNDLYSADDIADFLSVAAPGERVSLVFKRAGSSEEVKTSVTLGQVDRAALSGPRLAWQYSGLGQLDLALEEARAKKKKVMVGLSGAET